MDDGSFKGKEEGNKSYEQIINEIKNFNYKKVWVTKKARMEAESRVSRNDTISNIVINYYNLLVLAVSIYALVWDTRVGAVLTTITSVGLFGISNYINSMNYKELAFKYRESYLRLSKLETKLNNLMLITNFTEKQVDEFKSIREEYDNILELSYNHIDIDYIVVNTQSDECSKDNLKKYMWYKIKYRAIICAIFILPIAIGIFIGINGGWQ